MLSGAIIRDLHEDPSLREVAVDRLLGDVIHADGGLVIYDGSEEAQCSFEETFRKPQRFFSQPEPASYPQIPQTRRFSRGLRYPPGGRHSHHNRRILVQIF